MRKITKTFKIPERERIYVFGITCVNLYSLFYHSGRSVEQIFDLSLPIPVSGDSITITIYCDKESTDPLTMIHCLKGSRSINFYDTKNGQLQYPQDGSLVDVINEETKDKLRARGFSPKQVEKYFQNREKYRNLSKRTLFQNNGKLE